MTELNLIPTLITPRLTLRPFALTDDIRLHQITNEPGIMRYFPRTDPPDIQRVRGLIERQFMQWKEHNLGWWAVLPRGAIELIGWNGLQYLAETGEVEVGYLLSRQFWGQGYATEGARAALDYGFNELGLQQIIGLENIASQNVLKKCGMKFIDQKEYFGMQLFRFCLQFPSQL